MILKLKSVFLSVLAAIGLLFFLNGLIHILFFMNDGQPIFSGLRLHTIVFGILGMVLGLYSRSRLIKLD